MGKLKILIGRQHKTMKKITGFNVEPPGRPRKIPHLIYITTTHTIIIMCFMHFFSIFATVNSNRKFMYTNQIT